MALRAIDETSSASNIDQREKLRAWVISCTWIAKPNFMIALSWRTIDESYCFMVCMHYLMLVCKEFPDCDGHSGSFFDILRRYKPQSFGKEIRAKAKHTYYARQYIRLYGGNLTIFD